MSLFSANPWLAKMMQVTTALYGAGEVDVDIETGELLETKAPETPEKLNIELKQYCGHPTKGCCFDANDALQSSDGSCFC